MSLPRPGPGPPHPILPIRFLRPPTPSHHALWLVEHHFGAGWFVANGGSVCSTWRIGRVGLEAVRAFSQLRGLSGLLWSVITPSARDQLATVDFQAGDIIILLVEGKQNKIARLYHNQDGSEANPDIEARSPNVHLHQLVVPH